MGKFIIREFIEIFREIERIFRLKKTREVVMKKNLFVAVVTTVLLLGGVPVAEANHVIITVTCQLICSSGSSVSGVTV